VRYKAHFLQAGLEALTPSKTPRIFLKFGRGLHPKPGIDALPLQQKRGMGEMVKEKNPIFALQARIFEVFFCVVPMTFYSGLV